MRNNRLSACVAAAAVLLLAAGCSCLPDLPDLPDAPDVGGLFGDNCAPPAVAEAPCDPPPVVEPICEPTPQAAPVADVAAERPSNVRPGEVWCYVRVPAVTRTEEERICVRQATYQEIQVPAQTQQVERKVCVRQASVQYEDIPAAFEDRHEQICTAPARTEWARVDCAPTHLREREQVGECWTLREIAPQFQTKTTRVCVRQASRREIPIPPEFETRLETVVVQPARVDRIPVPAEYETRLKEVVVQGPRWEWRRTSECEVPDAAPVGGMAPVQPPIDNGFQDNGLPQPAPVQPPVDDNLPPAGGLPPLR